MEEIKHPTYGTLDKLLREIANSVKHGEWPRIGHNGALAWFVYQYAAQPHMQLTEATDTMPDESDVALATVE